METFFEINNALYNMAKQSFIIKQEQWYDFD